jgi:hypothetical protein
MGKLALTSGTPVAERPELNRVVEAVAKVKEHADELRA